MRKRKLFGFCIVLLTARGASAQTSRGGSGPVVARRDPTADTVHGVVVSDPYRWMEDVDAPQTVAWIRSQDNYARGFFAGWSGRDSARARMASSSVPFIVGAPVKEGNRYFFSRTRGAGPQQSFSLFTRAAGSAIDRKVLDGDSLLLADGAHIRSATPAPGGRLLAYASARGGDLHEVVRIRDVDSGRDLADSVGGVDGAQGAGSLVWARQGVPGFFYTRFVRRARVVDSLGRRDNPKIYFHEVGTPSERDELVFERPDHPEWVLTSRVSDDGRYLVISAQTGVERRHRIFVRDLTHAGSAVVPLIPAGDAEFFFVGNAHDRLWFQTTLQAPNGRIIEVPFATPERTRWRTLVPPATDAIDTWIGTRAIGDRLFVTYRHDAVLLAKMYDTRGRFLSNVRFDQRYNSMWAMGGRQTDWEGFYVLQGVADPGTVYSVDARTGVSKEFSRPALPYDPRDFVTEQRFFMSKDGTRVPMYVVHHRNTKLDGTAPGMVYGYGFNGWAGSPWFQPMVTEWMREGGVWALANIRGGGEYGLSWEQAGRRRNKQRSIDDFIAAAAFLVANHLVAPRKLVATSNSAGGVVAAAAVTQRPELFAASILDYPLIDMYRYHTFSGGARWTEEYGTIDDPADFAAIRAYAPLAAVRSGVCYPPTLLAPGEKDLVATPVHAYKFAAALQFAVSSTAGCTAPTFLRVSWGAGHSAGATANDQFDTWADQLAFLHLTAILP